MIETVLHAVPNLDAEGRIVGTRAMYVDITKRKQAEAAFRESEEQVRLLLNSTGEAIYGVDMQGHCTFCNHAFLRMLGFEDEQEVLGQNMHDLIHHTRPNGEP